MDLNLLKKFSRKKDYAQPQPDLSSRNVMLMKVWSESQPRYESNPSNGEAVMWDRKMVFSRNALEAGFTPSDINQFVKENRL